MGDPDVFASDLWARLPQHLRASDPDGYQDLLSLDDVDLIVSTMGIRLPAFRLVRDGQVLAASRYTKTTRTGSQEATGVIDAKAVFAEFEAGATIVFQSMHRYWAPLADYCRLLEIALGHPVQANAYITPPGAQGFGAHEDEHDVFVLQTHGAKHWRVHDRHDLPPSRPPVIDAVISAGDSLYIPAGFPHSASTQEEASAHITIGILAVRWADLLNEAMKHLESDPEMSEPLPLRFADRGEQFTDEVRAKLRSLSQALDKVDPQSMTRRLRRKVLTTRQPMLRGQMQRLLSLSEVGPHSKVVVRTGSIVAVDRLEAELSILLGDRELRMPAIAEPSIRLLAGGGAVVVDDLPGLDGPGRLVLVRRLIREGLLEVVA